MVATEKGERQRESEPKTRGCNLPNEGNSPAANANAAHVTSRHAAKFKLTRYVSRLLKWSPCRASYPTHPTSPHSSSHLGVRSRLRQLRRSGPNSANARAGGCGGGCPTKPEPSPPAAAFFARERRCSFLLFWRLTASRFSFAARPAPGFAGLPAFPVRATAGLPRCPCIGTAVCTPSRDTKRDSWCCRYIASTQCRTTIS